jgi:3-oxo-5alpha-steroid 4-dehydrogenase
MDDKRFLRDGKGFSRGDKGFSRRDFLRGSVVAGAGLAVAGLASGCAPQNADNPGGTTSQGNTNVPATWDRETDVVIVGFGGAGVAAAIEARKAGADVTVLEVTATGGGSTAINGGMVYLGGTALQKKLGVEDSAENMFKHLMLGKGSSGSEEALRLCCDGAPALYDWLVENGCEFAEKVEYNYIGGGVPGIGLSWSGMERQHGWREVVPPAPRAHIPQPEATGMSFFRPLKARAEELGIEALYETPGKSLIVNDKGRVVGVYAEGSSGEIAIKARKAVILSAGGFTNNTEMIMENWLYIAPPTEIRVADGNEKGQGINMGIAVGAATSGMTNHQLGTSKRGHSERWCEGIYVNEAGRRFIQEDAYNSYIGRAVQQQVKAWFIADDTVAKPLTEAVKTEPNATADSLEALAEAVGVAPAPLVDQVRFYNESCDLGEDREFGKESMWLKPIVKPPFAAFYMGAETIYLLTCGGLKINLDAQVINRDGEAIPGLYAAGRNANAVFGHYIASGFAVTDIMTFGRIAGQKAAAESSVE